MGSTDLTSLTDEAGFSRTMGYDGSHRLTPDNSAPYVARSARHQREVDDVDLGGVQNYTIGPAITDGLATNAVTTSLQGVATVTNGLNETTQYTLNAEGEQTAEVQPNNLVQTWVYDTAGDDVSYTDGRGVTTTYTYYEGTLTGTHYANGTTESWTLNQFLEPLTYTDQRGDVTSGRTTPQADVLSETDGYGSLSPTTTTYTYYTGSQAGLVDTTTDGDGNVTTDTYNSQRLETSEIIASAGGAVSSDTTFAYNTRATRPARPPAWADRSRKRR